MEWIDLFGFGRRSSEMVVSDDLLKYPHLIGDVKLNS
jgi:hypothetical protein